MIETVGKLLRACGIEVNSDGRPYAQDVPRDLLLRDSVYQDVLVLVPEMKCVMSSSYLTSLQSTARTNQRWPLINLVRQVLKQVGFRMRPVRKSDGYDEEGKKRYRRFFRVEEYKADSPHSSEGNEPTGEGDSVEQSL
jgi:hypothetical protein